MTNRVILFRSRSHWIAFIKRRLACLAYTDNTKTRCICASHLLRGIFLLNNCWVLLGSFILLTEFWEVIRLILVFWRMKTAIFMIILFRTGSYRNLTVFLSCFLLNLLSFFICLKLLIHGELISVEDVEIIIIFS